MHKTYTCLTDVRPLNANAGTVVKRLVVMSSLPPIVEDPANILPLKLEISFP